MTSDFDLKRRGGGWIDFRAIRVQVAPPIRGGKNPFEIKTVDNKSALSL